MSRPRLTPRGRLLPFHTFDHSPLKFVGTMDSDEWPFKHVVMKCVKCGAVVDSTETDKYEYDYLEATTPKNVKD